MDNTIINTTPKTPTTIQELLATDAIKSRIKDVLQDKAQTFTTSLISLASGNDSIKACNPNTVFLAALTAASLDLPVNQNLGYAYIIPYKDKVKGMQAQFQIGYKGLLQLALRSGQFKTINTTDIREGELQSFNRLTGDIELIDIPDRTAKHIVGYLAYFKLLNGFEKTLYMSIEEIRTHANKYSKSYKNDYGVWVDQFDAMAKKTVVKLLIARYAPMTIEMNRATIADQAVLKDLDEPIYTDNQEPETAKSKSEADNNRIILNAITSSKTLNELLAVQGDISTEEQIEAFNQKRIELGGNK